MTALLHPIFRPRSRVKTPTVIQMEAVECGAAALGIILGYYGRYEPLDTLRTACGISRNGSKANYILRAAREMGLTANGYRMEPEALRKTTLPVIVFWNFNHYVVVEGFSRTRVYLNDPATGPRTVTHEEFGRAFTGIVLTFEPGPDFVRTRNSPRLVSALRRRLAGSETGLLFVVLASLGLVVPGLLLPIFLQIFVDEVLIHGFDTWIGPMLVGMALSALLMAALTLLRQYFLLRLETRLAVLTTGSFLRHILHLPLTFFNYRLSGEIGSRVALNNRVARLLSGELASTVLNFIVVLFYCSVLFFYDVTLTLIGITVALLNLLALSAIARRRTDISRLLSQQAGRLFGVSISGLQRIEDLKAQGAESYFFGRWTGLNTRVLNTRQRLGALTEHLAAVPVLLTALNTTVILGIGGLRVMNGVMSIGMLVAFQGLMVGFLMPFLGIVRMGRQIQEIKADVNRLDDVCAQDLDPQTTQPFTIQSSDPNELTGLLEIRGLTFGYNRFDPPFIQDFDLTLEPGARVALVGPTGCGKSTIARLVSRQLDPWSGEIRLDGRVHTELPRILLNRYFSLVDQDIFLFEGTIRENLTLWDKTVSESSIIRAARDACIHDMIVGRQGGYGAAVEEGGRNFSGGERQRLEIARALVQNPTLVVLDEATSTLDPVTEQQIDRNMRRRGCSGLIIAHRLSTIRDCDEIIVLDKGRVVQRGTHEELLQYPGGLYRTLVGHMPQAA